MKLVFTANALPLSWLIRQFEGSEFSHVSIIVPGANGQDDVIEASAIHGVSRRPLTQLLAASTSVKFFDIPLTNENAAYDFAIAQMGKMYDYTALLGFLVWRDWQEDSSWYCSELVGTAMEKGGFTLAGKTAYSRVGVRLMLEFCQGLTEGRQALAAA